MPVKTIGLTNNAHLVNAAAATAMAVNAASATTVVKAKANAPGASQTALKPRFLLKNQCQMELQTNKYGHK